jgi:hypothetical protein
MTCHARSSPKINSQCAISATRPRTGNTDEPFSPGASLRELAVPVPVYVYVYVARGAEISQQASMPRRLRLRLR